MSSEDDPEDFRAALAHRLAGHSARSLASRSFWGRTVVGEIKSGRRLPTQKQLDALLTAVGANIGEQADWAKRLAAAAPPAAISEQGPAPVQGAARLADTSLRPRNARRTRQIVVTTLLAVSASVVLVLVGVLIGTHLATPAQIASAPRSNPDPAPTHAPSSAETGIRGTILNPANGTEISSSAGARFQGTLNGELPGSFWLLDLDPDGTYTVDLPVTVERESAWTALDQPIGDPGDIRSVIKVVLVYADHGCETELESADFEDQSLDRLPSGCMAVDHVDLIVARR